MCCLGAVSGPQKISGGAKVSALTQPHRVIACKIEEGLRVHFTESCSASNAIGISCGAERRQTACRC